MGEPSSRREVAARDAAIPFTIQSRADLVSSRMAVEGLARAGCVEVWIGAESGSQKILDAMDKGTRVEQIVDATHRLRAAGIRACLFLQFGYLGETFEDILATVSAGARRAAGRHRRQRLLSAARHQILRDGPGRSWARRPTGRTATTSR